MFGLANSEIVLRAWGLDPVSCSLSLSRSRTRFSGVYGDHTVEDVRMHPLGQRRVEQRVLCTKFSLSLFCSFFSCFSLSGHGSRVTNRGVVFVAFTTEQIPDESTFDSAGDFLSLVIHRKFIPPACTNTKQTQCMSVHINTTSRKKSGHQNVKEISFISHLRPFSSLASRLFVLHTKSQRESSFFHRDNDIIRWFLLVYESRNS